MLFFFLLLQKMQNKLLFFALVGRLDVDLINNWIMKWFIYIVRQEETKQRSNQKNP